MKYGRNFKAVAISACLIVCSAGGPVGQAQQSQQASQSQQGQPSQQSQQSQQAVNPTRAAAAAYRAAAASAAAKPGAKAATSGKGSSWIAGQGSFGASRQGDGVWRDGSYLNSTPTSTPGAAQGHAPESASASGTAPLFKPAEPGAKGAPVQSRKSSPGKTSARELGRTSAREEGLAASLHTGSSARGKGSAGFSSRSARGEMSQTGSRNKQAQGTGRFGAKKPKTTEAAKADSTTSRRMQELGLTSPSARRGAGNTVKRSTPNAR